MPSTILFLASARSDGNTSKIGKFISQNADVPMLDFNDFNISYYNYEHNYTEDDFFTVAEQIIKFDTIVLITPVYWYSMSAQMKTFLDRFTDLLKIRKELGRQLKGKHLKVVCCSSDSEEYPEFWSPFKRSAEYLGMNYHGHMHTWIEESQIPTSVKNRLKQFFK